MSVAGGLTSLRPYTITSPVREVLPLLFWTSSKTLPAPLPELEYSTLIQDIVDEAVQLQSPGCVDTSR